jgi:LDH2 family malate/lactate/ureidoglycolate dehydrogenase
MLDMATTTVAYGRVRNKTNESLPTPPGWVLDAAAKPSLDPRDVTDRGGFLTSLGGPAESSGYKGYGLAMMANILSAGLAGGSFPTDPTHSSNQPLNLAHFFMAMDPAIFRDPAEFRSEVARFGDAMRATPPLNPEKPVLVAGDPERATAARRRVEGIPVGEGLKTQVRTIAEAAGAAWLLG